MAAWKKVTDAVHAKGGRILLQLWHGGRACHSLLNNGAQPVAPSPLRIENDETHTPQGKKPYEVPRELRDDELPGIVAGFRHAAANAQAASARLASAYQLAFWLIGLAMMLAGILVTAALFHVCARSSTGADAVTAPDDMEICFPTVS